MKFNLTSLVVLFSLTAGVTAFALDVAPQEPQACYSLGLNADDVLTDALLLPLDNDSELAGRRDCIKWALSAGANPNGKPQAPAQDDLLGQLSPPLILAVEDTDAISVKALLQAGAKPNSLDDKGLSALARAAANGADDIIDLLIAAGANVNSGDRTHAAPLLLAVNMDDAHAVRALLDHGANVNAVLDLQSSIDNLETALDSSTVEGNILGQMDKDRKTAGNDADRKMLADSEIMVAQKDRSPKSLNQLGGTSNLRSFDSILADQRQIADLLKAAGAKCATDQCGGILGDPIDSADGVDTDAGN